MKKIALSFLIFSLISCTSNTIYKKPKDLIPKDTMVMLLTDMYLASSAKYSKNIYEKRNINYMFLVYEKYKIDSLRFQESNTYYTSKLEVYEDLLKQAKNNLIKQKDTIKTDLNKLKPWEEVLKPEEIE